MPPKKLTGEKKKIVEDKTFGLKNKNKSAKVGRYVETVKNQAMHAGQSNKDRVIFSGFRFAMRMELYACVFQRHQSSDGDGTVRLTIALPIVFYHLLGLRTLSSPGRKLGITPYDLSTLPLDNLNPTLPPASPVPPSGISIDCG